MPNSVEALQSIPFRDLIGGPLKAAVEAQTMAAESTVQFIERVGFLPPSGSSAPGLRTVTFAYEKKDGEGMPQSFSLTVPLLAIVPVPFIRLDEVNIDFSAKLNDVVRNDSSTSSSFGVSLGVNAGWGWGSASLRASYSRTSQSSSSATYQSEYNMSVKVRAGAAPMPEGMAKILDILEQVITEEQTS